MMTPNDFLALVTLKNNKGLFGSKQNKNVKKQ